MTEHELLTWLERWFRDNTLLTVDPSSPRSEVWFETMIDDDIAVEERVFDLRDLCDALVELARSHSPPTDRAERAAAIVRYVMFGEMP